MEQEVEEQGQELSRQYHPTTKKTLQKVFIILLVVGAIFGEILSIGVISLMQKVGFTDVPARVQNLK